MPADSLYTCIVYTTETALDESGRSVPNRNAVREFGTQTLEEIRTILFDIFRANPVFPRGPYYQVRILDRGLQRWLDLDGKPADHPDGWLNVEVRIQCGRGIL